MTSLINRLVGVEPQPRPPAPRDPKDGRKRTRAELQQLRSEMFWSQRRQGAKGDPKQLADFERERTWALIRRIKDSAEQARKWAEMEELIRSFRHGL
jgi:hypothetical protein